MLNLVLFVVSLAVASGQTLTALPLSGTITDSTFGASVNVSYGYLSTAQALFLQMQVRTPANSTTLGSTVGFLEAAITFNSTHTQNYQFSIATGGLCGWQGLLNTSSSAAYMNQNPSKMSVTSITSASAYDLKVTFQISPFSLTSTGGTSLPTFAVSVGPSNFINNTYPLCTGYSKMGVIIMGQTLGTFAPFSSAAQISQASTNCMYGSPNSVSPFPCQSCFLTFTGTKCDAYPANVTTTPAPTQANTSAPTTVTIIKLVLTMDIANFNVTTFVADVASLMNISASRVQPIQYYAGSVVVLFFFDAVAVASNANISTLFVSRMTGTNAFTSKYNVASATTTTGYATTGPVPTTAWPVTDGGGDSGLTKGQIAVLIIVIIVIIVVIIVAVVVYLKRSKEGTQSNPNRGQQYNNDQQMQAIGAQPPAPSKPSATGRPTGAPQPNYGDI